MNVYNLINHQIYSSLPTSKSKVIYLYRRIFRLANSWEKPNEKKDILEEARREFHINKSMTSPKEIDDKLEEARSRILLAAHYRIPYAKKVYAAKTTGVMSIQEDPNNDKNIC